MAKIVIKQPFWDRFDPSIFREVGDEVEVDAERAAELVSGGWATELPKPKPARRRTAKKVE